MVFGGDLQELPFEDVIQFIYATKKSGTLHFNSPRGNAALTFNSGYIVSVTHPDPKRKIGTVLVEMEIVPLERVEEAARIQAAAGNHRKPLIATLLDMGVVKKESAWEALRKLIEMTIAEIFTWDKGTFELDPDSIIIEDDYRYFPEHLRQEISLDTQMLLVNAVHIFEERAASELKPNPSPVSPKPASTLPKPDPTPPPPTPSDEKKTVTAADLGLDNMDNFAVPTRKHRATNFGVSVAEKATTSPQKKPVVFLLSPDPFLVRALMDTGFPKDTDFKSWVSENEFLAAIEAAEVALVDNVSFTTLASMGNFVQSICKKSPGVKVIALVSVYDQESVGLVMDSGARSILLRPPTSEGKISVSQIKNFVTSVLEAISKSTAENKFDRQDHKSSDSSVLFLLEKIRGLDDPQESSDVTMNLLKIVAERFQRTMIFLVRPNDLIGIASAGFDLNKEENPIFAAARVKIPLKTGEIAEQTVKSISAYHGPCDATIKSYLFEKMGGPPAHDTILLLPLRTRKKTIAVVYGDFGSQQPATLDLNILEILSRHAGIILENAFYRKQLDQNATQHPAVQSDDSLKKEGN